MTTQRSQLVLDKAIERVRKLLALAKGTSEHEAAAAAGAAAKLVEQFQLTEAMIRLDDTEAQAEPIEQSARLEPELPDFGGRGSGRKRIAWKETIAKATASDLGIHMYWTSHVDMRGFGRESAIQTWRYMYQYLCRAVDQLAEEAWEIEGDRYIGPRAWKNAFRVGCAQRLSTRIWDTRQKRNNEERSARFAARTAARVAEQARAAGAAAIAADALAGERQVLALAIVAKDQAQVNDEYREYSKSWRGSISSIGSTSSSDGYSAGKAAGDRVALGGKRGALRAGQGRLKGGR